MWSADGLDPERMHRLRILVTRHGILKLNPISGRAKCRDRCQIAPRDVIHFSWHALCFGAQAQVIGGRLMRLRSRLTSRSRLTELTAFNRFTARTLSRAALPPLCAPSTE